MVLTMSEKPQFGDEVLGDNKSNRSTDGNSGPSIPDVSEGVAQLVIDAIQQKGGLMEIPAFSRDAPDFQEAYADHYDLPDVETLSVEDLFGYDWSDYDYVGTPPVTESEELSDEELEQLTDDEKFKSDGDLKAYVIKPDFAEDFRDADVLKGGTTPISKAINGLFGEAVVEAFGEDSKVSVGKGKKRNHDGDAVEAMTHVAFWVSDSETAPFKRKKAANQAGRISDEEFAEWAEANGFEDEL